MVRVVNKSGRKQNSYKIRFVSKMVKNSDQEKKLHTEMNREAKKKVTKLRNILREEK